MHFLLFVFLPFQLSIIGAADWCQESLGCQCSLTPYDGWWSCKTKTKSFFALHPPDEHDRGFHIECNDKVSLNDVVDANLTLGVAAHVTLLHCGITSDVSYATLFRALKMEGLTTLKIDMGHASHNRPLRASAFAGFQDLFPTFRQLILERISVVDEDVLSPLSRLQKLTIHSWTNISFLAPKFLTSLHKLEHLEIYGNPELKSFPDHFFDGNVLLKVLNLSSNSLELLQPDLFVNLTDLKELVLNHNFVTSVSDNLFVKNSKLKTLMWNQVPF
jgi:hypothetical protein